MNLSYALRIASLVLFVIAAVFAFITNADVITVLGLEAIGLGAWVGSTLI